MNATPAKLIRRRLIAVATPAALQAAALSDGQQLRARYKAALERAVGVQGGPGNGGDAAAGGGAALVAECKVSWCLSTQGLMQLGGGVALCCVHAPAARAALAAADPELVPGGARYPIAASAWASMQAAPAAASLSCVVCSTVVPGLPATVLCCRACSVPLLAHLKRESFNPHITLSTAVHTKPYFQAAILEAKAERGGGGGGPAAVDEGPVPRAGKEKCCVGYGAVAQLE